MRLALAQLNPTVGDVEGNAAAIAAAYAEGLAAGADVVVVGELAITGYPPEDLLLKPAFVRAARDALTDLAAGVGPVPLVVGVVEELDPVELAREAWRPGASTGAEARPLANAAAVLRDGRVEGCYRKQRLPNYGVFDEARYFRAGTQPLVVDVAGIPVGITICEDLWGEGGPVQEAAAAGARVVLNLNASPYERGKRAGRERWATHHAAANRVAIAYVNQVGGQDEVVFDGDSFVVGPDGAVGARGAQLATDLLIADVGPDGAVTQVAGDGGARLDPVAEVYAALVLGTRDYVGKNGFARALLGVSGGIDSALVAAIAVDALGPDRVTGVAMPSPWSSPGSLTDAEALCTALGAAYLELPIAPAMRAFDEVLAPVFAGTEPGVAEENLQSRIRGTLLMALSNKRGDIVLATGNKSEYAVGYSTLYGDMAGGFAVIKDVPKTLVYALAEHVNAVAGRERIPRATIDKPPSAELRPDQVDTDSLPPYDVLDPILAAYVEQNRSIAEIVRDGHDEAEVRRVAGLVDRAEYKRRQAAPGVKITRRAFGKDRRPPITQRWSG
jgi:NAD+ synthase (glutamine-hydrolysing)